MPDIINPYIPGQPVDIPELFFGRRDILTSIREYLLRGRRVFAVAGAPRMGKSTLLRQLPKHLPEEYVAARVELLEEEAQQLDWLLWRVAEAISVQLLQIAGQKRPKPEWAGFEGNSGFLLEAFWPKVRASLGDRCLILLLDDLDSLAYSDAALLLSFIQVLEAWRARDGDVALVVTTSVAQQDALLRDYGRLFGGAQAYLLGPLSSDEATQLITWPVDGVLTYDYGVARRVIEITSGQPYYLQLLCFEIFNRCAAAGWVNQHDVDLVVEQLVGREIADFRQVWDDSSPQEQAALAALVSLRGARGVATVQEVRTVLTKAGADVERQQVAAALERLTARGVLERLGALSYRFRVALLRDWLCERLDLREVVRKTRWGEMGSSKATPGRAVLKLSTGRGSRDRSTGRSRPATARADDEAREEPGAAARRWPWIGGAIVLVVVILAVVGAVLFWPAPAEPTPAAVLSASPTARLAAMTATRTPLPTDQPTIVAPPTETPRPLPTDTPSPTPPVVVARSVPSIAYQSRAPGESRWFVYSMDSDGSNRTRLAEGQSGFLSAPTWAPDGSRIAFVSDRDGKPNIWVMDSDGGNLVNLTQQDPKDHSPAWSPDGEWIAFASVRDSLYWELYAMRPDGSDVRRLTWWEDASDLSPSWSPDGTRLAFASKRDGNWELYVMDREGDNLTRLTDHEADDTNPAWSPDGSRIAFSSTRDGYPEIYVMPIVGGQAVNISNAPFSSEHGPTWSPDGGRIAFYSDRDGDWDIYVMASDGSDVVKLTGDNTNDQSPAWRP
jgi:Tol biopolymer transport system component